MTSFADLRANLNLNISNFTSQLNQASRQARSFAANLGGRPVEAAKQLSANISDIGLNFKSVARIVSGIVISQAFYTIARAVRNATDAVWEFTKQLEYAQISYSNLFGDVSMANELINVLKDFAAKTPFTFTEAEKSTKRLLAYGIEAKNVMYVMQGVMAAAAAQGDSSKIENISRAIGQIFTYGKLMTAEVRQLTEAGIPVYDILQEKLGLTQEQLRNLGNEAVPASVAINALIDGINERFGNVVAASSLTINGLISNIKDNALMLGSSVIEPLTVIIKSGLKEISDFLFAMREIVELKGIGGIFEALFPPEMHETLRQFVANFKALFQSGLATTYAFGTLLKPIMEALIRVFNAFAPILTTIRNFLAGLIYTITSNATAMKWLTAAIAAAAAMWVLFKAKAVASLVVTGVITLISKALAGLSAVLTFVVAHPFWALLVGLTGIVVGISGGFGKLSDKVNNFFKSLTQFNGIDPDKVLLPSQKERANDISKFNEALDMTSDSMDDLADSTGKATKAAKSLLSFDEVFKLNEPDEGAGSGIDTDSLLEDLAGVGDVLGGAFIPEVPDFSEYMNNFKESFTTSFTDMWEDLKANLTVPVTAAAIGAIIGGALGFVLGGPTGAKIGAKIGTLVGGLWGWIANELEIQGEQHVATLVSGLTSGIVKAVGYLGKNLTTVYIDDAFAGFARNAGLSLTKALKQGLLGAIIGLATGVISNALAGWIAKELNLSEQDLENAGVGQTIGSLWGTIVGMLLGGPVGGLVGGAIAQVAGTIIGEFWAHLHNILKGTIIGGAAGTPVGAIIGLFVGSIGGPLGAAIGALVGMAIGALVGAIVDADWSAVGKAFTKPFKEWGKYWGSFFSDIWKKIKKDWEEKDWFSLGVDIIDGIILGILGGVGSVFGAIDTFFQATVDAIKEMFGINSPAEEMKPYGRDILYGVLEGIINTISEIPSYISSAGEALKEAVKNWFDKIKTDINDWSSNTKSTISEWSNNTKTTISTWSEKVKNDFSNWSTNVKNTIGNWSTNVKSTVNNWSANVKGTFDTWSTNTKSTVNNWSTNVKSTFSNWSTNVKNTVSDWWTNVKGKFDNLKNTSFSSWVKDTKKSLTDWATDVWSSIKDKIGKAIDKVKEFLGLSSKGAGVSVSATVNASKTGHATGGIFNREHIARFAEGNKAEAVIPLENATAMQPFVDAVSNGITASLAPILANISGGAVTQQQLQPLYVGTLIADERGLKQLYKKFEVIQVQEDARRGLG